MKTLRTLTLTSEWQCEVCGCSKQHRMILGATALETEVVGIGVALEHAWAVNEVKLVAASRDNGPRGVKEWQHFEAGALCPSVDRAHVAWEKLAKEQQSAKSVTS